MKNKLKLIKATMFLLFILGGSGLCLADDKAQASDWYSPDWEYRKAITVDNTISADVLTDYQILVTLSSANFDYAKANANGSDLRFTDSDELTEISYWIEDWNTAGDSKIWVKVPAVSALSTATVYLYYGNANATTSLDSFDDTMQKLKADDDTAALWHFDEEEGMTLGDSSVNENDGTLYNFTAPNGWIADSASEYDGSGSAVNFDGTDAYIEAPDDPSLNFGEGDFTVEAWAKVNSGEGDIITKAGSDIFIGYSLYSQQSDGIYWFSLYVTEGNSYKIEVSTEYINLGEWYHIVGTRSGNEVKIYLNGNLSGEGTVLKAIDVNNAGSVYFGTDITTGNLNGSIDEIRVLSRVLSAEEIKANYERRQYTITEPTNNLGVEETNPYNVSETVVATDGGEVTNTADTVVINIPANALETDTEITIEVSEAIGETIENFQIPDIAPVDYVYTFGPEGTTFSTPVILTFDYNDTGMTLTEEQELDIYWYDTETTSWVAQGATVDTDANTLTISITHFSKFVIGGNIIVLEKIDELLLSINNYYEEGKIEKSAYFLSVHLKRVQRLLKEGDNETVVDVLEKFIEKVERFTPDKIEQSASDAIIIKANEVIDLL